MKKGFAPLEMPGSLPHYTHPTFRKRTENEMDCILLFKTQERDFRGFKKSFCPSLAPGGGQVGFCQAQAGERF